MTSALALRPQPAIRFRGRSFIAFVLAPAPPIADWLVELDKWTKNSPDFFVGKPIILDLAALSLPEPEILQLITILGERGIRVMGLEGVDANLLGPSLPPLLKGGRPAAGDAHGRAGVAPRAWRGCGRNSAGAPGAGVAADREPDPLGPVRGVSLWRRHRARLGVLRRRGRRRRLDPRLRHAARARHRRAPWAMRGRASSAAGTKPSCSRSTATTGPPRTWMRTLRSRPVQCWLEDRVLSIAALD